ncbi:MAG: SHOCT domain-containing protein [Pseudomonadota bacterium]|nr:SHOCT domain-containing protein [Pseudomonadota bacterium]
MRDELRVRLLVHDKAALVARNLFIVHKAMGKAGWDSVAELSLAVLAGAVADAEGLQRQEPTPLMEMFLDRLGELRATVEQATAQHEAEAEAEAEAQDWALTDFSNAPEVSEASHEDYELMERSWIGTVPSGLIAERERKHVMPYSGIPIERWSATEEAGDAAAAGEPANSTATASAAQEQQVAGPLPLGTFRLDGDVAVTSGPTPVPVAAARGEADAGVDVFVAIEKLAALHAKGILTEAEFAAKKSELLSRV